VLLLGAIGLAVILYKRLEGEPFPSGTGRTLVSVLIAGMVIVAVSAFIPQTYGIFWEAPPEAAAVGPVVPGEIITPEKIGYVVANVNDAYKIPTTAIEDAEVHVSLDMPTSEGAWLSLVSENTASNGSCLLEVPGVTSGQVYVAAQKSGYYPAFTTTVIPGAQIISPSLSASIELAKIGSLKISLTDNSNASFDESTLTITENVSTSTSAYFTLNIYTENAYTALRDLRIMLMRGDDWDTLDATIAPVVLDAAETSISTTGDVTLTSEVTGAYHCTGDVTYGEILQIKITTAVGSASAGTMFKIYIDDLDGSKDIFGGTGISENVITVKTVT